MTLRFLDWAGLYPLWLRGSTLFDSGIINESKLHTMKARLQS